MNYLRWPAALLLSGGLFAAAVSTAMAAAPDADLRPEQAEARALFAQLIGFETSAGKGRVPAMVDALIEHFRSAGFADADIHRLPLGETESLLVRYAGDGSGGKPILLMAHLDVVTAKREDWQRDPFTLIEEQGYFYGRGSADVKDGVASLTSTFIRLRREGFVPTRDLIIVFSGDEETEMLTIQDLAKQHRALIDAEFALNSDGGGGTLAEDGRAMVYSVQTAEKTYASFELSVHNAGGHSSLPRDDNAIYDLAAVIGRLRAYRFPVMWNDTTRAAFAAAGAVTEGAMGEAMRRFAVDPTDREASERLAGNPAEVGATRTTCIPTLLRGGHADNALPQSATVTVNCRIFPGVAVATVRDTLAEVAGPSVEIRTLGEPVASDASPLLPEVMQAIKAVVHARYPGIPVVPMQESGASDGLYLRAAGIPTYGVSGMFIKDSDDFAHGLDERVPVKEFYAGLEHWYQLVKTLTSPNRVAKP